MYALCTIFTILLTLWNSEQKNGQLIKLFCFSFNFHETWWSHSYPCVLQFHQVSSKSDVKQKCFINSPFFCPEYQCVSRIVKIVHSATISATSLNCTFLRILEHRVASGMYPQSCGHSCGCSLCWSYIIARRNRWLLTAFNSKFLLKAGDKMSNRNRFEYYVVYVYKKKYILLQKIRQIHFLISLDANY